MKSLWQFMREKRLTEAIRCSFENFGEFTYTDPQADNAERHITMYAKFVKEQFGITVSYSNSEKKFATHKYDVSVDSGNKGFAADDVPN